jgi:signal transduction histidine kinase
VEDISLHILDIVENSIVVDASKVVVYICEDLENDLLILEICDNGSGMSEEKRMRVLDPFFTTKEGKRVGLGIPFLAQAAEESEGSIEIESEEGKGTRIRATFKYSHPDRRPLGKIEETMKVLKVAHPNVEFVYKHEKIEKERISK